MSEYPEVIKLLKWQKKKAAEARDERMQRKAKIDADIERFNAQIAEINELMAAIDVAEATKAKPGDVTPPPEFTEDDKDA